MIIILHIDYIVLNGYCQEVKTFDKGHLGRLF